MDLIIGRFADVVIGSLSEAEVAAFEHLSQATDHDLYAWIAGDRPVDPAFDTQALGRQLTMSGLEVESITAAAKPMQGVVVAEVNPSYQASLRASLPALTHRVLFSCA